MKTIKLLPVDELKVLKVIQIEGPEWNRFTGYLPYTRIFNPKVYDNKAGDILDEKILSVIQHYFPKSFLRYNIEILFKEQLEDNLKTLEGGSRKKVTIQFSPDIPYELLSKFSNRSFYAYPGEFEIRLLFNERSEKMEYINEFYLCSLPFDILDEIVKTVKPI